jgi:hypothetical protein
VQRRVASECISHAAAGEKIEEREIKERLRRPRVLCSAQSMEPPAALFAFIYVYWPQ